MIDPEIAVRIRDIKKTSTPGLSLRNQPSFHFPPRSIAEARFEPFEPRIPKALYGIISLREYSSIAPSKGRRCSPCHHRGVSDRAKRGGGQSRRLGYRLA